MKSLLWKHRFLFMAIALVVNPSTMVYAEELPLEYFVRQSDYLDLTLSPDGKHVAGRVRQNDKVNLYVFRVSDGKVVTGVEAPSRDIIHTVTWVNPERLVYEFAEKTHFLDQPIPTGELYGISIDGTDSKLLYGFRASDEKFGSRIKSKESTKASQEIISILRDDPKHILILEHPWEKRGDYLYDSRQREPVVSKLNVYSGRKKRVEHIPFRGASVLASDSGEIRFVGWRDNEGGYHAAKRDESKADWVEIAAAAELAYSPIPIAINSDSSRAYFLVRRGEQAYQSIYELDLGSGEFRDLFPNISADVESWQRNPLNGEPYVAMTYNGGTHYHYVDDGDEFGQSHKMLRRAFKGRDVSIVSTAEDGVSSLVHVSSAVNPGEFYHFNRTSKAADFAWANSSWIDQSKMSPVQASEVEVRDGLTVEVYLTTPKLANNRSTSAAGLLVMLHGGPHGVRDYLEFNSQAQLFASRGFAVLQVNFRGSYGYGLKFEEAGYREWGGKMIEDIVDATRWANKQGYGAEGKTCVFGASYGGYAAMMAAAREPELYKCAVGYVGVYDLKMLYTESDVPDNWGGLAYLEKVIGTDEAVLEAASPVSLASQIKADVMLIHGSLDRRAPLANAVAMRKALKAANKEVVWQTYKNSGHGVWNFDQRLDLHEKLLNFLAPRIGDEVD